MDEFKTNIVYKIELYNKWGTKDVLQIKSNLADDKLVECEISTTLRDYLIKNSATLEPDKLLIKFAEAQKRQIELEIENLNDLELSEKTRAESFFQKRIELENEYEKKMDEFLEKYNKTSENVRNRINNDSKQLQETISKIDALKQKLDTIDSYSLERLTSTLNSVIELAEKDNKLFNLIVTNYNKKE